MSEPTKEIDVPVKTSCLFDVAGIIKPGWQTTEFWLTILAIGFIAQPMYKFDAMSIAIVIVGYTISRGITKHRTISFSKQMNLDR